MNPDLKAAIDDRLAEAVKAANYRITLNAQKQNARLKLQKDLTYAINGGIFHVTPELISFVHAISVEDPDDDASAILLDVNQNPIEIERIKEFLANIKEIYFEAMNDFLVEFKSINKQRTVKGLIGDQ